MRKQLSLSAKNVILIRHCPCTYCGGLLKDNGGYHDLPYLADTYEVVHYDHVEFHALGGSDTNPRNFTPLHKSCHEHKTRGTHVPLSGDVSKIAKVKRLQKSRARHDQALATKGDPKPETRKRPWPKRKLRPSKSRASTAAS